MPTATKTAVVDAIRKGAYDYLAKPFEKAELLLAIRKAEERERLARENRTLKESLRSDASFDNIVARSEVMHAIFRTVRKVAAFKSTVLVTGESGTGKELIARAVHFASPRADKPFVAVNCGAIPETLLESELFGHVKGAFTDASRAKPGLFEEADGGTIFLDEIGALPLALQVKILRVLQEDEVRRVGDTRETPIDVRVVAATLDDLATMVDEGEFREDLFYRLNVIPLQLPPLRDRKDDIPLLCDHFLARYNQALGTAVAGYTPDALEALVGYHWPGNVRQLQNVIERAMVLCESERIGLDDLPPRVRDDRHGAGGLHSAVADQVDEDDLSIKKHTRTLERELIRRALVKTGGNRTHAAKLLELSHRALLYKIKDYELRDVK